MLPVGYVDLTRVPVGDGFVGPFEVGRRFPCSLLVAVPFPLDKILSGTLGIGTLTVYPFHFEFVVIVDSYGKWSDILGRSVVSS
jgi:hypothetical protein